jgi:beta-barrel assembly-enhancing protease
VKPVLLLVLIMGAVVCGPAQNPKKDPEQIGNRDVSRGVNFDSIEKEIALGKGLAAEVERTAHVVDDPAIAEYVNRVGQNLTRNSDSKLPLTIKVIESEEPNAFSLPGGFFFVHTGLIANSESEAELAAAMAHEIAHIAARHSTRQATRGQMVNLATIPLIFIGGWPGYGGRSGSQIGGPLANSAMSREFEDEADILGLQYLYKTGYDPAAFVDFFERMQSLEQKKPGFASRLLATHPQMADRVRNAQTFIQQNLKPRPDYVVNTSEFATIKTRVLALGAGIKQRRQPPTLYRRLTD